MCLAALRVFVSIAFPGLRKRFGGPPKGVVQAVATERPVEPQNAMARASEAYESTSRPLPACKHCCDVEYEIRETLPEIAPGARYARAEV